MHKEHDHEYDCLHFKHGLAVIDDGRVLHHVQLVHLLVSLLIQFKLVNSSDGKETVADPLLTIFLVNHGGLPYENSLEQISKLVLVKL